MLFRSLHLAWMDISSGEFTSAKRRIAAARRFLESVSDDFEVGINAFGLWMDQLSIAAQAKQKLQVPLRRFAF